MSILTQIIMILALGVSCSVKPGKKSSGAAQPLEAGDEENFNSKETSNLVGVKLYSKHCASCHMPFEQSTKRNSTVEEIEQAIAYVDQMKGLSFLTQKEIELISKALSQSIQDICVADKNESPRTTVMRRLNNYEYKNSIEQLLDLSTNPILNFPKDSTAGSFSNIGSAQTLSTKHLEEYLLASETAVKEAFSPVVTNGLERRFEAESMNQSAANGGTGGGFFTHYSGGELRQVFNADKDGVYRLSFRAFEYAGGPQHANIDLKVNGQVVQSFSIDAVQSSPAVYETDVTLGQGSITFALEFTNDYYQVGPPEVDLNVAIDWFNVRRDPTTTYSGDILTSSGCSFNAENADTCGPKILKQFANFAWRRPVQDNEINSIKEMMGDLSDSNEFEKLQAGLQSILMHPEFIFRVEISGSKGKVEKLSAFELASRLSYFIWGTAPDSALRAKAESGALLQDTELEAEVQRLLSDSRSTHLSSHFVQEWFDLKDLAKKETDTNVFRTAGPALFSDMTKEIELLFNDFLQNDRNLLGLLDTRISYVNERTAPIYGVTALGNNFRKVTLAPERKGILTRLAILTATSGPVETIPIRRGLWVLDRILCSEPPPPPTIEAISEEHKNKAKTKREQMELHRANPACASCHELMDPIGLGLENFDAIGQWRTSYKSGEFIDVKGLFPGDKHFSNPTEMGQLIKEDHKLSHCFTEKFLTYASGFLAKSEDQCVTEKINSRALESGFGIRDIILEIVRSPSFQYRLGKN